MAQPIGTVSFLFTDIQGSSSLWENHPEEMRTALARHDALMREAIENNEGYVFKTIGDAFCAAFATAPAAAAAALEAQLALQAEPWLPETTLKVRMGLHTGAVEHRDDDYFGPPVNRVARLMSVGHGNQILVSAATQELIRDQLPLHAELLSMGAHRLKDLARSEEIYQVRHPGLPSRFPTLKSLSNPELPNNLPLQLTSFIGREKETAEVGRLLSSTATRLLTLSASGGTGKTRLALQVAADCLDEFPDGVWFVELAGCVEPSLVAPLVASLLHISEASDSTLLQTLAKALKPRKLLLILDNCEHLLSACSELADALLRNCPNVSILASSREAMNLSGEIVYPLRALALPDPKKKHSIQSLAQFDAVRLFLDRALAVRPDFSVTNENAAAVAQLCHRLDGIPLALELAAARIRSLPVEEINGRLDNRFRLLTGGSRNSLPRQQTLRALIDWSYDLLNEQEKRLFARLSVFSGGWTLSAAEAICSGGVIEEWETFDLLTALIDKSLAVSDAEGGEARYRALETLREYGKEKLTDMNEAEAIAERHALSYAAELKAKSQQGGGVEENDFPWLLTEADNVRAALDWLWQVKQVETAAAISVALREFWTRKGWFREAEQNLGQAVRHATELSDKSLSARVYKDAGWFAYLHGDLRNAERLTELSVEAALAAGAKEIQANALNGQALIAQSMNDFLKAETLFKEAIVILRPLDQDTVLADCLMNLGLLHSMQEKHDAAMNLFSEAKSIYERRSNAKGMAIWLCNQSDLALRQSNWQEAQSLAEQSLERCRQIEFRQGVACALANLAKAASRQGHREVAEEAAREAFAICLEINLRDLLPMLLINQAGGYLAKGKSEIATLLFAGAIKLRALLNIPSGSEEQSDISEFEENVRVGRLEEMVASKRSQLLSTNMEYLLTQMSHNF